MPHATFKIRPGVNSYETQVLNEASINSCNLIRYAPSPDGLGLVQKLGGWERFFASTLPSTGRALWAWQHSDTHKMLGVGCDNAAAPTYATLEVIHDEAGVRSSTDITPLVRQDNPAVSVTTTTTSNAVTIDDLGANASQYDAVYIPAHIAVGGIIIFGFYQAIPVGADQFQVALYDLNGNPVLPTTGTTGGAVALFTPTSGSSLITVTLVNHGYIVGDVYPVLIQTTVGGVVLEGNAYAVLSVIDADNFTISAQNQATNSTPVSINGGNARYNFYVGTGPQPPGTGYGVGGYGAGGYGSGITPAGGTGTRIDTTDWSLDNWGDLLLACPTATTFGAPDGATPLGGPIYVWNHAANNSTALALSAGPVANAGFFVAMPQRQIIAYGSEEIGVQDALLVRWCDIDDFNDWLASPVNLAGKYRLTRGSRIVGGMQIGQQGLLLTDVGAWTMNFIGSSSGTNAAYSFREVARGCGLIAQKAMGVLGGAAWWMGLDQFYTLGADGVQPVPCPLWDLLFQNLDRDNLRKIRMGTNASFGEIALYYPSLSGGTGEVDSYIKYNTLIGPQNGWDMGGVAAGYANYSRTAWLDQSVFGQPIGADGITNLLQQHEISNDADGVPMHPVMQTGFFVLEEGELLAFIDQWWPDMKWGLAGGTSLNAQLLLTFFVKEYPNDTARTYGPFTLSTAVKYITPRFRGRLVAVQLESVDLGSFWRMGGNRYRYQPAGKVFLMVDSNSAGSSGFGAGSISDVLSTLKDTVVSINEVVDGLGALAPHYSSGQIIAAKLVQTGFVRVTGISVYAGGGGIGTLYDTATLAGAITAAAIYPVTASAGFYPVNMVFQNGLVYLPSSAQIATLFYART